MRQFHPNFNLTARTEQLCILCNQIGYPRTVFDSLGEAYMKGGDTKFAQENYEKVLALDPANANAKAMLAKIRKSQTE